MSWSSWTRLKTLVVANPSQADRERTRSVFAGVLAKRHTVVRQYPNIGEMTSDWPACFIQ